MAYLNKSYQINQSIELVLFNSTSIYNISNNFIYRYPRFETKWNECFIYLFESYIAHAIYNFCI